MFDKMVSATNNLLGDASQMSVKMNSVEEALLDEMNPPSLLEKSLPILAVATSLVGFFALISLANVAQNLILFGPLFLVLYQYMRTERRQKAQKRSFSTIRLLPSELTMLQQSLRKNQHNVNI